MKKKTYKLQIRQASTYQYQVIVPEIGAKKTAATLDRALNITLHDILNHLTTCPLIRVFADQMLTRTVWVTIRKSAHQLRWSTKPRLR